MFPKREILIIKQQQLLFKIIPFALLVLPENIYIH